MKIAHLSDLHLNSFYRNSNLKGIKSALRYAMEKGFDHLVITGDLTDNSSQEDFRILRNLFRSFNLLHGEKISLVIGNHDIFGGIQTPEDIFNFPKKCALVNYKGKIREFFHCFEDAFENCIYISKYIFPYAKLIDGVLITGLNSNAEYSRLKNPFASNGKIDESQLSELNSIYKKFGEEAKIKILLLHHHFNKMNVKNGKSASGFWLNMEKQTMKLRKKKKLLNLFNQYGIDLVLHGHYHENAEYTRKGIRFLNAGCTIKTGFENELHVNFIEIKNNSIITEIHKVFSSDFKSGMIIHRNIIEKLPQPVPEQGLKTAVNY
ncbi:MAG TPA: metallophosphoesterase [Ignavibacteriaceae bacterium]|nr:metallophosphoesterase [Ignavibacteriaceae bacterium]